jgi:hypothetical protein
MAKSPQKNGHKNQKFTMDKMQKKMLVYAVSTFVGHGLITALMVCPINWGIWSSATAFSLAKKILYF